MSNRILVLHARRWSMVGEKGDSFSGVSVHFVEPYLERSPDAKGFKSQRLGASDEVGAVILSALEKGPFLADAEFGRRPGRDGKSESVLNAVKPVETIKLMAAS